MMEPCIHPSTQQLQIFQSAHFGFHTDLNDLQVVEDTEHHSETHVDDSDND